MSYEIVVIVSKTIKNINFSTPLSCDKLNQTLLLIISVYQIHNQSNDNVVFAGLAFGNH